MIEDLGFKWKRLKFQMIWNTFTYTVNTVKPLTMSLEYINWVLWIDIIHIFYCFSSHFSKLLFLLLIRIILNQSLFFIIILYDSIPILLILLCLIITFYQKWIIFYQIYLSININKIFFILSNNIQYLLL